MLRPSRNIWHQAGFFTPLRTESGDVGAAIPEGRLLNCQLVYEDGQPFGCAQGKLLLYFVAPEIPAFTLRQFELTSTPESDRESGLPRAQSRGLPTGSGLRSPQSGWFAFAHHTSATSTALRSPYYRLTVDLQTGGISKQPRHSDGGVNRLAPQFIAGSPGKRSLCQTVYFDGKEHTLQNVKSEAVASGPVLARLKITGTVEDIQITPPS